MEQPQPTAATPATQYQSGITYAQSSPPNHQSHYAPTGPAFHYSHSAPGAIPTAQSFHHPAVPQHVQYVHQPIAHGPVLPHHQPVVYYSHHAHYPQEPVQYVSFEPQHPGFQHISSNLITPTAVPQVHEEGRTYAAPSRHTLETNTQQQKYFKSQPPRVPAGFRPKQQVNPQPQFVYVQANNVASAQQQRQYQQKQQQQQIQTLPQHQPSAPQKNVEIIPSQGQQVAPVEYVQQQISGPNTPYYQYSGTFGHPQPTQ